jgi:hypothetical protein
MTQANIVCSGQAGALPRLWGFCPKKQNLRSEFFLPIPRLPLTLAVGRLAKFNENIKWNKLDC